MDGYKLFVVVDTSKKINRYMSGVIIGKITHMNIIKECNFYSYKCVNLKDIKNLDGFISINEYFISSYLNYTHIDNSLSSTIGKQIKTILKYNRIWVEKSKSFVNHGIKG